MGRYCSGCGSKMLLVRLGKPWYETRTGAHQGAVGVFRCPKYYRGFNHDKIREFVTADSYKVFKAKYDKTHPLPLPNVGIIIRKGL